MDDFGQVAKMGAWRYYFSQAQFWCSEHLCKLLEIVPPSTEEVDLFSYLVESEIALLAEKLASVQQTGGTFEHTFLFGKTKASQTPLRLLGEFHAQKGEQGSVQGMALVEENLPQKKGEQHEQQLHSLFENSPIAKIEVDYTAVTVALEALRDQGVKDLDAYLTNRPEELERLLDLKEVTGVNLKSLEMSGLPDKETFFEHYRWKPDPDKMMQASLVAYFENKPGFSGEVRHTKPTGGKDLTFWFAVNFPEKGDPKNRVIYNFVDITARKLAEAGLAKAENLFRELARNFPSGSINLFDREYRYLFAEGLGLASVGLRSEDLIGKTLFDLFPPDQVAIVMPHYEKAFQGESVEFDLPLGELIFHMSAAPMSSDRSEIDAIIVIARDVTEDRTREKALQSVKALLERRVSERTQALQKANQELTSSNKELATLTYSVSHDLRTPLRGILGYSEILRRDYGDRLTEDAHHMLGSIIKNAHLLAQLVDDMLDYGRLGRHEYRFNSLNMGEIFSEEMDRIRAFWPDFPIEFDLQALPNTKGDSLMVRQLIHNLLSNAVKYSSSHPKAQIRVWAETSANTPTIYAVQDKGVGFNPEFSPKIFKIFERLHSSHEFEGTGVGLAIVDRVVKGHGGKVWGESSPGKGATFYFTLSGDSDLAPAG